MAQRQRVGFQIQRLGVRIPLGSFLSSNRAWMAEWSKALDLSSSIRKNAWVRTPLEASPFASDRSQKQKDSDICQIRTDAGRAQ